MSSDSILSIYREVDSIGVSLARLKERISKQEFTQEQLTQLTELRQTTEKAERLLRSLAVSYFLSRGDN